MKFIYNIGIGVYFFLIKVASLWNEKAKKRCQLIDINSTLLAHNSTLKTILFHCASVGEFEQGYPLLQKMRTECKNYQFIISFFSPSGYEFVGKKYPNETIVYLPKDTQKNMQFFIEKINPTMVFIVKYEFWYHFINELHKKQTPTYLVSGIFRKNHIFFKPIIGSFFVSMLKKMTHIFVQNEESKTLLHSINISHASITGDTRFDRVIENKHTPFNDNIIDNFCGNHPVFIAGSCWNSDIPTLNEIAIHLPLHWKIIVVPHEINHFSTSWLKSNFQTYSTYNTNSNNRFLVINQMGLLSKLYRYATFCYVGGGFGKGIHNTLEAAVYEKPILFGKKYQKFNEAIALKNLGAALAIENEKDIKAYINFLLQEENQKNIAKKLQYYIAENTNVSEKIIVYLKEQKHLV